MLPFGRADTAARPEMNVPLSAEARRRVDLLFAGAAHDAAARLLETQCGDKLPFMQHASAADLDRVRFAALKLSQGRLDKLREAIALAQVDWRDLLMAAGFGHDVDAHRRWLPVPRRD